MAMSCAWCGSTQTAAEVRNFFCFSCGRKTDFEGRKVDPLSKRP